MARRNDRGVFERPKGSDVWWIRWCCTEGHLHRKKIGSPRLAAQEHGAQRKDIERSRRLDTPCCPEIERKTRMEERRKRVPFREIAQDFLDYARVHKRDKKDGQRMARLLAGFRDKLASEITPQDVENYKATQSSRLAPATVNRDLALLKATFNRARKAGKVSHNPARVVPLFKENNARTRCLTDEEEARLYSALPDYLRPFLVVALHSGMRWGELARLTWDDVDFYTGTLHVRESKSGEGRRIPMNKVVRETLEAVRRDQVQLAREQSDGEREILSHLVFCSPRGHFLRNFARDWYPALRQAKIADFRWHDTRHTAASRLVMAGVDLYTVKEILGHKTLAMTARYSHLSPGHQRQALERLASRHAPETPLNDAERVALALAPKE